MIISSLLKPWIAAMRRDSKPLKRLFRCKSLLLPLWLLLSLVLLTKLMHRIDPSSAGGSRKKSSNKAASDDVHLVAEASILNDTLSMGSLVPPPNGVNGYDLVPMVEERETICYTSYWKSSFCEMVGDIRVNSTSATVHSLSSSNSTAHQWRLRPRARKDDPLAMINVREFTVTKLQSSSLRCQMNHTVPAVIFSTGGFAGNYFHDMADILVPLFVTSHHFSGEVQLLVSDFKPQWIAKYQPILNQLTRYDIINLDVDDRVRCFSQAIVGLKRHDTEELAIDPSKNGLSLKNFTGFLRSTFSLRRSHTTNNATGRRPLLLVIARKWSRRLENVLEIMQLAESVGFDVVVGDGVGSGEFASVVNACDAVVGVHGAGLTNMVFLPEGAVVVQVLPLAAASMKRWMEDSFGLAATGMGLRYVQYEIDVEESTLVDLFPENHPVLVDPEEILRKGEDHDVYLTMQNVRLDVARFRMVLSVALELLRR